MGVGKRIIDLAKANLSDFAAAFSRDDDLLTAEERAALEEEIRQATEDSSVGGRAGKAAKGFRDKAEEAWERAYEAAQARAGQPGGVGNRPSVVQRAKWLRTLELAPDATQEEIRKSYRRLMRKYHPDRWASDEEKFRTASEVARKITEAYNGLKQE